jgi:hypothetical protein
METIEKHRAMLAFLEDNNDLPLPNVPTSVYVEDKETMLKIARRFGTKAKKVYDTQFFNLSVEVGDGLTFEYYTYRNAVCTVTRTETVVVPASPSHTYEKPVEWECHPLLDSTRDSD